MNVTEYRIRIVRTPHVCDHFPAVLHPEDVAKMFKSLIDDDGREHFIVLFVDSRNTTKGFHEISVGGLTSSIAHPREAFRAAIGIGAAAVLFAHNHPSGNTAPSHEDVKLTRRLCDAGRLLGVPVLDHVIVGDGTDSVYSFADEGELSYGGGKEP